VKYSNQFIDQGGIGDGGRELDRDSSLREGKGETYRKREGKRERGRREGERKEGERGRGG
jgi:hypothetical protein